MAYAAAVQAEGSSPGGRPTAPVSRLLAPAPKQVLLIYPESRLASLYTATDTALRETLLARLGEAVTFSVEYLDLVRHGGDNPDEDGAAQWQRKYAQHHLDLIVVAFAESLRFALDHRAAFPGKPPIVFIAVDRQSQSIAGREIPADVTGTWLSPNWAETLAIALRLQPGARRALVVTGSSSTDRVWLTQIRRQIQPFEGRIEITYLTENSMPEVMQRVSTLSADSILLLGLFVRDAAGDVFVPRDAASQIAAAAKAPAYSALEGLFGTGVVGGRMVKTEAHGQAAADLAARVLKGERPTPHEIPSEPAFDARQFARWELDERALPPGSTVQFKEQSLLDRYKWYLPGALILIVVQAGLIIGLLLNRTQRMRAQQAVVDRLRFETLLSELTHELSLTAADQINEKIERALGRIGEEFGFDRATLTALDRAAGVARITHRWQSEAAAPLPPDHAVREFPWIWEQLSTGRIVTFASLRELPKEAETDRRSWTELKTLSLAIVPLVIDETVRGSMSFTATRAERAWPADLVQRLRLLAEILGNALARRDAEHAARESEARFRRLADAAPILVWLTDDGGSITYVNKRGLEFSGRLPGQNLGALWSAAIHPDDLAMVTETYRAAAAERRQFTLEYRVRRHDGEYRWLLDHNAPRHGAQGVFRGFIGSAIDVTDVKAARKALAESDELRSAVFGSLEGRVVAIDAAGAIIAVNDGWTSYAGLHAENPAELGVGANYLEACRRAAESGERHAVRALECMEQVRDGRLGYARLDYACRFGAEEQWFELSIKPLRWPEGGLLLSHLDISRRVNAEAEARRKREELSHVQRWMMLGELAATLAHEINQPLGAIVANSQAARQMLASPQSRSEDIAATVKDIADDARRAADVIGRLRSLVRKQEPVRVLLELETVVHDALELVRADFASRGITVQVAGAEGLPPIEGDPVELQQVMLNLLINASDALASTRDPGGTIAIDLVRRTSSYIEVLVRDSGAGCVHDDLEQMFRHFVTSKPAGLGLGLAISRSIVEAHGGEIWASRNADRGLTLHLVFPAAPEFALA